MLNRTERGDRYPAVTTAAIGGGTRLGIMKTTTVGVGDKEGRRGRKTEIRFFRIFLQLSFQILIAVLSGDM